MAVANANPVNTRGLLDANFIKTVALPNAANTVNTNAIDLVQAVPYPTMDKVVAQVFNTAGTGANSKNINIILQDSADNSSFANIAIFARPLLQLTESGGSYAAATPVNVILPPGVRRYVRAQATGEANGGDASDGDLTLQLLF